MEQPDSWTILSTWPAWRGLRDELAELEQLLRQLGEAAPDAADLADEIALLITEPGQVQSRLPTAYRTSITATRTWHPTEEEGDLGGILSDWVSQLALHLADAPTLLESPAVTRSAGHLLTTDLPRNWQQRFGTLRLQLRQGIRAGGRRGAAANPAWADEPPALAERPPLPLRYLFACDAGYAAILPAEAEPAEVDGAWRELLYLLLRDLGVEAARLHLLLLTAPGALPYDQVYQALGLNRKGLSRREKNSRCDQAIRRLGEIRVKLCRWSAEGEALTYACTAGEVWDLAVREYGQSCLVEQGAKLVTRGEEWSLHPGPGSLVVTLSFPDGARFGHLLLESLDGAKNPLSLAVAVVLAAQGGAGQPVALPNREALRLAGAEEAPQSRAAQAALISGLRRAVRLQRRWGWVADLSGWPAEALRVLRGKADDGDQPLTETEWQAFLDAATLLRPELSDGRPDVNATT